MHNFPIFLLYFAALSSFIGDVGHEELEMQSNYRLFS